MFVTWSRNMSLCTDSYDHLDDFPRTYNFTFDTPNMP
jgi:hypothetical protein